MEFVHESFADFVKNKLGVEINEGGGEAAGKMELIHTPVKKAHQFADETFEKSGKGNLDQDVPNFDANYKMVQDIAKLGQTQRKDMPVINDEDVDKFKARLEKGYIDITEPFANDTNPEHPFPTGLAGLEAQKFLVNGLRDKNKKDDIIDVRIKTVRVGDLMPIQKQIYADKSIESTAKFGVDGTRDFLENKSFFVISADRYIIDGHHRWLSGNLIDPDMNVHALEIEMPIAELLPLSTAYGDAIGNKRNA